MRKDQLHDSQYCVFLVECLILGRNDEEKHTGAVVVTIYPRTRDGSVFILKGQLGGQLDGVDHERLVINVFACISWSWEVLGSIELQ